VLFVMVLSPISHALDIESISVNYLVDRLNGTPELYSADFWIKGTGITGGEVVNTITSEVFPLTLRLDGSWGWTQAYGTEAQFLLHHQQAVAYEYRINEISAGVFEDCVTVGFYPTLPASYPGILDPSHGDTGVPLDVTYLWDNIEGLGWAHAKMVLEPDYSIVFGEFPDGDMTKTSWAPGTLPDNGTYQFGLSVYTITSGGAQALYTAQAGDLFGYFGTWEDRDRVQFTTVPPADVPEPVTLALVGTAMLGVIGWRRRQRLS
jgi:hypothetical protein